MTVEVFETILTGLNLVALAVGATVSLYVVFQRGKDTVGYRLRLGILVFWLCELVSLSVRFTEGHAIWLALETHTYIRVAAENLTHMLGIAMLTYVVWQLMPQIKALRWASNRLKRTERDIAAKQDYEKLLNQELDKVYDLLHAGDPDFVRKALKITSHALQIGRVGFYISKGHPDALHSVGVYDYRNGEITSGHVFDRSAHPVFRDHIKNNKVVQSKFALEDPRLAEFRETWLAPHDVKSICYINLEMSEHASGSMFAETVEDHRDWTFEEISFLRSVGDSVLQEIARGWIGEQQRELSKAQAEFEALSGFTQYWDVLLTPDGRVSWSNRAAQRITGFEVKEIVGRDDYPMFLAGDDAERTSLKRLRDQILNGEKSPEEPVLVTTKYGRSEWLVMDWRPVNVADHSISGYLVTSIKVTDRVQAEESLKRTEKARQELDSYIHTFHEHAPTAVILTHLNREIASWNPTAEQMFGYSEQEALGQKIDFLFPRWSATELEEFYKKTASGSANSAEMQENRCKDGTHIYCEWNDAVIKDDSGTPIALFSVASDVTKLVEHQKRLEIERQRFEDFSTAASDFFWETDAMGTLTHMSQRFFDLADGMTKDDVIGKPFGDLAPAGFDESSWLEALRAMTAKQPFRSALINRRTPQGHHLRISLNGIPVWDDDGAFAGFRGSGADMDEAMRQSSVAKMIALNIRGLTGEDYFSALVRSMYDYLESDWVLVGEVSSDPSPRVQILAGYGREGELVPYSYDLLGTPLADTSNEDPVRIFESGAVRRFPNNQLITQRQIEGYAGIRLVDANGDFAGVLIAVSQRSLEDPALMRSALEIFGARATAELSRRRSEASNETLQQQLMHAQRMETMGALAGGIAHDFNNILTPIMGYSEILASDLSEGTHEQRDAAAILNGARRARTLVKQILDFSRHTETSRNISFDVSPIVRGTTAFVKASIPAAVDMQTEVADDLPYVKGDPSKFDQVLMNLITNAWQSLGDEAGTVSIGVENCFVDDVERQRIAPLDVGSYVRVTVTDTGCGIPEDLQERIFEPFFTTKGSGSGTGFGLSTARGIVEAMDGTLRVSSAPGAGSTFSIYLPATNESRKCLEDSTTSSRSAFAMASRLQSTSLHILYVDDEAENTKVAARMLEGIGHVVSSFEHPTQALAAIEEDPYAFDIMVTDDSMPEMSGSELCRKALSMNADIPIIVVTGGDEKDLSVRYGPLGITEHVTKPFGIREITDAIQVVSTNSVNKILERF